MSARMSVSVSVECELLGTAQNFSAHTEIYEPWLSVDLYVRLYPLNKKTKTALWTTTDPNLISERIGSVCFCV